MTSDLEKRKPLRMFRMTSCKWCMCARKDHLNVDGTGPCARCDSCDEFCDSTQELGERPISAAMRRAAPMFGYELPEEEPIEEVAKCARWTSYSELLDPDNVTDRRILEAGCDKAWENAHPGDRAFWRRVAREAVTRGFDPG